MCNKYQVWNLDGPGGYLSRHCPQGLLLNYEPCQPPPPKKKDFTKKASSSSKVDFTHNCYRCSFFFVLWLCVVLQWSQATSLLNISPEIKLGVKIIQIIFIFMYIQASHWRNEDVRCRSSEKRFLSKRIWRLLFCGTGPETKINWVHWCCWSGMTSQNFLRISSPTKL